jgi:bifunctional non-homologous end joining protein LigD
VSAPFPERLLSHPDKLLFPADGITKRELAAYYAELGPVLLPHLRGRPVTLERFPAGIAQQGFIQKDVSRGAPDWLARVEVPKRGGSVHHPLIEDVDALVWMANQNCITPHVWTSRAPRLVQPDLCVFDLDPSREDPVALRAAALAVRELLAELGLECWIKTSGSKGFHIVVPLDAESDFDGVFGFARTVGALLVKREPEQLTQEFIKADREGRMLIDTGRNGYSATFASVYAVRARPGAPVSAPCTWAEVEEARIAPQSITLRSMPQRLAQLGDLWQDLHARPQPWQAAAAQLESLLTPEELREAHAAATRKPAARKKRT